ncbi:MAG TPA: hypothetical protein VEX14_13100, partial [Burkholderiaceae bacterium]|nr:hypothetical protein [Burkholderiaceae bacterium]
FTLQHDGAPVICESSDETAAVNFEMRYADGFFLRTASADNTLSAARFHDAAGLLLRPDRCWRPIVDLARRQTS